MEILENAAVVVSLMFILQLITYQPGPASAVEELQTTERENPGSALVEGS
jgi:hypothetical protein